MVNWIFIWFKLNLKTYESIFHFSYERQNEIFRYDALIAIENKFTQEIRFYFIEVDISNNKFDKVKLYTKFYQELLYKKEWWIKYVKRFPVIIVLTHRKRGVEKKIEEDNFSNLEFKVFGLDLVDEMKSMLK